MTTRRGLTMTFALPDPETEPGARVARRLDADLIAWLTLTDREGTPQPAPVWFLWDTAHATALIYSQPSARRLARLESNPRCSFHLNDNGLGGDFMVFTGHLVAAPDAPPADRNVPYAAKYGARSTEVFGSVARFASLFSIPLLFHPERIRVM
ncbi:MAG: TIGR03667 family PPOX class F420-dependent oxidoreductase [Frankia sp.]